MRKTYLQLLGGVLLSMMAVAGLTSCNHDLSDHFGVSDNPSEGGGSSTINATDITLDQTMKVIKLGGGALTITATATPAEATLTWESSDEAVATVENGVVTPVGAGIATITAKSGDVTATCEVFVGNEVTLSSSAYTAEKFDILKGDNGDKSITIPDGIKVAFNEISTTGQIICSGDATIYLTDGSTNTVNVSTSLLAGIQIGAAGTLTINAETAGDGKLTVQGGNYAAGIGTNMSENGGNGGNIVINGGMVTAEGGTYSAGIGTGDADGSAANECGTITINGGTVIATGGDDAAGIGTGVANKANTCGAITINGGTVTATGGERAAGIGTGWSSASANECGAIMIGTGVTSVTATKGDDSPNSIGTGKKEVAQNCGTITFGTLDVFNGSAWTTTMTDGNTYGGLKLAISGNDWTLTPAP